uniref:Uncharacterized protein n=1 Tax=Haptolina ericina TaxID=156174 RepID=A0A7S3BTZ3_9EUKA|mmetsp:Transcript_67388/g.150393  ORF Transcript_67388/g.150393 Transcript_67388/m.150393 type:complete len:223 (+) Transcript_67388:304-972(+)
MDRMYAVNVKGVFHCLKAGVNMMLADGKGGAIVNLASIASVIGLADGFAYSMSKGAVLTMTLSVATDYVKKGIRCNCVCPGRVHTPFLDSFLAKNYPGKEKEMFQKLSAYQPIGRMGRPEEIAGLILYLCSDEAAFVRGQPTLSTEVSLQKCDFWARGRQRAVGAGFSRPFGCCVAANHPLEYAFLMTSGAPFSCQSLPKTSQISRRGPHFIHCSDHFVHFS